MKYFFLITLSTLLFSCDFKPAEEPSAQELLQRALEKAEEEGISPEELAGGLEAEADAEISTDPKQDSIELILKDWHRDFRIFNGIGVERPDSIRTNFSGVYELETEDYHFKLSMGQTGIHLRGSYCGYTNAKSDCGMPSQGVSDPLVKGKVVGDTAHIYYYSNYANDFGWAKIYLENDTTLIWKATKTPEDALYIGTPYDGKLILKGDKQEDYEVWPAPNMIGC